MKTKVLISDVGGVLVYFDWSRFEENLARVFRTSTGVIRELYGESPQTLFRRFCHGQFPIDTLLEHLDDEFSIRLSRSSLKKLWISGFRGLNWEILDLFSEIRRRHRISIISCTDVDPIFADYLYGGTNGKTGLLQDFFDAEVRSYLVRAMKPDPTMYRAALVHAEIRRGSLPAECVFVDDLAVNVHGARAVGLDAIHFEGDAKALAHSLASRGLALP